MGGRSHWRSADALGWVLALLLMIAALAANLVAAQRQYHALRTGWSWDLAYYNQWYWALTQGDGMLSVRPIAAYASEGPSVWKTNYLSPLRYALVPIYACCPGPLTLVVAHAVVFWWIVPAAYGLVRHETGSPLGGLLSLPLVLCTPLVWPMAMNDFRELQMGLPFAVWAIDGVRGRRKWLAGLGVAGLLACRQEFAVWVATLAFVPARCALEPIQKRFAWCATLWFTGLAWLLVAFFGFLVVMGGWSIPEQYLNQFRGGGPTLEQVLGTAWELVVFGLGAWVVLSLAAPRMAVLALPWLWNLANGRWALRLIATESWHHVRYAVPFLASSLGAGLVGWSRLWNTLGRTRRPQAGRLALVVLSYAPMFAAAVYVQALFGRVPPRIDPLDLEPAWTAMAQVKPEDGVLAHYDLTAPLSSRRLLFSYVLDQNKPAGYPRSLPASIHWVFIHPADIAPEILQAQGFSIEYSGPSLAIYRR